MKYYAFILSLAISPALIACQTSDAPRKASPPPGSHSPWAQPDDSTFGDAMRDQPEPPPPEPLEDEPDEPETER